MLFLSSFHLPPRRVSARYLTKETGSRRNSAAVLRNADFLWFGDRTWPST
jgi:hypothetical protein